LVTTVRGELLPIKWVARNVFRRTGPRWPQSALPVRVSAFALDANTPHRDLYLSPGHCLFLEGHLMAVQDLVNATSITVAESPGTEIEYFHLILARHEVVLAEGAPTETLLVASGTEHESFSNFVEYERLYSNRPAAKMVPFAPRVGSCQGGGRSHLKALLRLAVAPDPLRLAYDKLAQRASAAV